VPQQAGWPAFAQALPEAQWAQVQSLLSHASFGPQPSHAPAVQILSQHSVPVSEAVNASTPIGMAASRSRQPIIIVRF